jgi:hypothetical protein
MRDYSKRPLPNVGHLDSLARQPEREGFRPAHYATVRAERIRREGERVGGPMPRGEWVAPKPAPIVGLGFVVRVAVYAAVAWAALYVVSVVVAR